MNPLHWLISLAALPEGIEAAMLLDKPLKTEPLLPSQDPWYKAPAGFETKQPGDVLRIRSAPGNLTTVVSNASAAYHILYRTTDSRDRPSWAVTSLFMPASPYSSPSKKVALMSYQFAYNSANLDSSPSIGLYWRLAQEEPNLGLKSDTSFIEKMLSLGWIVNTPDHLGPDAAFGASVQAGHATLDALRAVHKIANADGGINTAIWGYSGGSIATLAAAELQPHYAPELQIAGVALGGLVDDISADLDNLNKSPIAGTLIAFLLGITAQYPDARRYLENRLIPDTKSDFLSARHINVADAVKKFSGQDIYAYFTGGAADLRDPILQALFGRQAKLGHRGAPRIPIFVYKAIGDQYCPVAQTDATVNRMCSAGADISYERNTVGEHVSEIENGKPRAFGWLGNVFNESKKWSDGVCTVRDVTVALCSKLMQASNLN